jgi:hypothetical protein
MAVGKHQAHFLRGVGENMLAKNNLRRVIACGALALGAVVFQSHSSQASVITLLNWAPVPDGGTPNWPVINYTGGAVNGLQTDIGAIGNGDGNLPPTQQTPGGLQIDSPLTAPIPFSFPDSMFTGGTGYYDATLTFTGLAPLGNAVKTPIGPVTVDSQSLGAGTFAIISTAPAGSVVLLSGNITPGSVLTGDDGGMAGADFNSSGVDYTGGVLLSAAVAAGFSPLNNDMAISMTGVIPAFGVGANQQLNAFTSDATGLFDIHSVPEPTTLTLGLLGVGALAMRRSRKA